MKYLNSKTAKIKAAINNTSDRMSPFLTEILSLM